MGRLQFPHKVEELLAVVDNDFKETVDTHGYYEDIIQDNIRIYNNHYTDEDIEQHKQKDKSIMRVNLVKEYIHDQIPSLKASFLQRSKILDTNSVTANDEKIAKMAEIFINYVWNNKFKKEQFIDKLIRTIKIQGTAFVKVGWDYRVINRFKSVQYNKLKEPEPEQDNSNQQQLPGQESGGNPMDMLSMLSGGGEKQPPMPEEQQTSDNSSGGNPMDMLAMLGGGGGQPQQPNMEAQQPQQPEVDEDLDDLYTEHINQVYAEVIPHYETYFASNTDGNLEEANFVIHRYYSDLTTLYEQGVYDNLDQVIPLDSNSISNISFNADNTIYNDILQNFLYSDEPRKPVLITEYWGYYDIDDDGIVEPILCVIANDSVVIRLELNPLPDGKLPFLSARQNGYMDSDIYGEGDPTVLEVYQNQLTQMWRGAIDNMLNINSTQTGFPINYLSDTEYRKYKRGEDYIFNAQAGQPIPTMYKELPSSFYNLLQQITLRSDNIIGDMPNRDPSQTGGMGIPSSTLNPLQHRRLDLVRNITWNILIPMFKKWIIYGFTFLSSDELIRIVGKENYVTPPKDLWYLNGIDIAMEISTPELDQQKLQSISFVAQTMGQNSPPEITQMYQGKIFELTNMPKEAEFIKNYQPQPDPNEQKAQEMQLKQMELELKTLEIEIKYKEELLKAEIEKTKSVVKENTADYERKMADSKIKTATANFTEAKFVSEVTGKNREHDLLKHFSNLSLKEKQLDNDLLKHQSKLQADYQKNITDFETIKKQFELKNKELEHKNQQLSQKQQELENKHNLELEKIKSNFVVKSKDLLLKEKMHNENLQEKQNDRQTKLFQDTNSNTGLPKT